MKQYCRYCAHCFEGDAYYCAEHEHVLSAAQIKMVNQCKDFALSDLGDVITGNQYQPRDNRRIKGISSAFIFKEVNKE